MAQVQLAGGQATERTVGHAVDHHAARAADSFATVVLESDRCFTFFDEALVHDVQHFEKRGIGADVARFVFHQLAFGLRVLLAPYVECQVHYL
jgi:hypothetical protein